MEIEISIELANAMWKELKETIRSKGDEANTILPYEKTVHQVMDELAAEGIVRSENTVRNTLNAYVRQGKMSRRKIKSQTSQMFVYSPAKQIP